MTHQTLFSRRDFHRHVLAAGTVVAAGSFARAAEFPPGDYVDMHTHLGQTWNTTEPLTAEVLLRWMDAHKIAQAVVLPLVSPESSSYLLTSDFVLEQTRPYRDRLIPFCCIDPRTSYSARLPPTADETPEKRKHQALVEMLKRWVDAGAKGFGEHKNGLNFDDPRNMAVYAACAELKLPLLFHIDNLRNLDKPGLPGLENAVKSHPDCNFVGHGPGWWASISGDASDLGGYPKGKVAPGGAIDALMEKYPNIYGDVSAGSGAGSLSRDLDFAREFLVRRQDRIMFGTDFLAPQQDVPQFELFEQKLADLPPEVKGKVFRDNARKLLKLS